MTEYDRTFAAAFEVRELAGEPGAPDVEFSSEGVSHLAPTYALAVKPDGGSEWRGEFFGGRASLNEVVNGPAPDLLIAIAGGVGYVVPVKGPAHYSVAPVRPVTQVVAVPDAHVVICVGLTKLSAIGADGRVAWTSARLVADGFFEVRVSASGLVLRGRDPAAAQDVEMTIDPVTGTVVAKS